MTKRTLASKIAKESGDILFTIFVLLLLYGFLRIIVDWALQYRWLFPFVMTFLIGLTVFDVYLDIKSPKFLKGLTIKKGFARFSMMVLFTALEFGAISLWLANEDWAKYSPENLDLFFYNNYYLWQFFEMIPLLKVNDTLGFVAPLQPVGFVAGLPVLTYRIIVFFVFLKWFKTWWSSRTKKDENEVKLKVQ